VYPNRRSGTIEAMVPAARFATVMTAALAALVLAGDVLACGTAGCSLASRGDEGRLARGRFQVDASFRYVDQDRRMWDHGPVVVSGAADPEVLRPRVDYDSGRLVPGYHHDWASRGRFLQVDVAYGLTDRLTVVGSWPLLTSRTMDHLYVPGGAAANHAHSTLTTFSRVDLTTRGAGDAQVSIRYALSSRIAIGGAIKAPSGDYRLRDETDAIGDPMIQPGTGAWALAGTAQYSSRLARLGATWGASALVQKSLENPLGYRMGDEAYVTTRVTRPVAGPLSASLQAKAIHVGRSHFLGQASSSTGSTTISLAPGVRLKLPARAALYGSVQWPVFQHVNEGQLGTTAVVQVGISRTF
jgi:hypothetical protein